MSRSMFNWNEIANRHFFTKENWNWRQPLLKWRNAKLHEANASTDQFHKHYSIMNSNYTAISDRRSFTYNKCFQALFSLFAFDFPLVSAKNGGNHGNMQKFTVCLEFWRFFLFIFSIQNWRRFSFLVRIIGDFCGVFWYNTFEQVKKNRNPFKFQNFSKHGLCIKNRNSNHSLFN